MIILFPEVFFTFIPKCKLLRRVYSNTQPPYHRGMLPSAGELSHALLDTSPVVLRPSRQPTQNEGQIKSTRSTSSKKVDDTTESFKVEKDESFGKTVNMLRVKKGWSQKLLASKCNLSASDIARIESGKCPKHELNPVKQRIITQLGMDRIKKK